jgi:hypothetical protein
MAILSSLYTFFFECTCSEMRRNGKGVGGAFYFFVITGLDPVIQGVNGASDTSAIR